MRVLHFAIPLFLALATGPAQAAVNFSSASFIGGEGDPIRVTVVVDASDTAAQSVSVTYNTIDGTAQVGTGDYIQTSGSLLFSQGQTEQTFFVRTLSDENVEEDETVRLVLSNPSGVDLGPQSTADALIVDEDNRKPGTLEFTIDSRSVAEGPEFNAATPRNDSACSAGVTRDEPIQVRRIGGSFGEVTATIRFMDSGTAVLGEDFQATERVVTFADGSSGEATIPRVVSVNEDCDVESNEIASFTLSNPTGGASIGQSSFTLEILDDDNPANSPGFIEWVSTDLSAIEDQGRVEVRARRVDGIRGTVSARYEIQTSPAGTSGRASADDFSDPAYSGRLSWTNGVGGAQSISIPINPDRINEPNETFSVLLLEPEGAELSPRTLTTVTIANDDAETSGISFVGSRTNVVDESGSAIVVVRRSGIGSAISSPARITVQSTDGSAVAPRDYSEVDTVLTWDAGESGDRSVIVPISASPDEMDSREENLLLNLVDPSSGAIVGSPSTHQVVVTSSVKTAAPSRVRFESQTYIATEGSAIVRVARAGGTRGSLEVQITSFDGTAISGRDFEPLSQILTWGDGDSTTRQVRLTIVNSTEDRPERRFGVQLSQSVGGSIDPSGADAFISIPGQSSPVLTSDQKSHFKFEDTDIKASDADGTVSLRVARTPPKDGRKSAGPIVVRVSTVSGSAVEGTHFARLSQDLTWAADDFTAKVVRVSLLPPSTTPELPKFFSVQLSSQSPEALINEGASARVKLTSSADDAVKGVSTAGSASTLMLLALIALFSIRVFFRSKSLPLKAPQHNLTSYCPGA